MNASVEIKQPLREAKAQPAEIPDLPADCPTCKTGAPAWMATFADMATLLMAFFVLILSFSDTEMPRFEQINGSIRAAFGVKRIVPKISIPIGRTLIVEEFSPAVSQRTAVDDVRQEALKPEAENLIRNTQQNSANHPVQEQFRKVQTALAENIEAGDVRVYLKDEQVMVELTEQVTGSGSGGNGRYEESDLVMSQTVLEVAATVAALQTAATADIRLFRLAGHLPAAEQIGLTGPGSGEATAGDNS